MRKNFWNKILFALGIINVLLQSLILALVYGKNGGTTGANPVTPVLPFAISLIIGVFIFVKKYKISNHILNLSVIVVSIFGCLLPYWLERTGILVQYDRWIQNEQIINTENIGLRLLGFAGIELLILIGLLVGMYQWFNTKSKLQ